MELDKLIEGYEHLVHDIGPEKASGLANRLFRSRNTALALAILLRDGLMSTVDLQDLGVPMASAYRSLAELRKMGILTLEVEFQASPYGGPRTKIWRVRRSQ